MAKKLFYDNMDISERVDLELRDLYKEYGYSRFKMGKLEDYDLYTKNKDFIPTENIITVTGQNGRLLALRPDLTLSIVKYYRKEEKQVEKLYYSENIYRGTGEGDYQEIRQTGLECLGEIHEEKVSEVAVLAAKSLKTISGDFVLEISHMGFLQEMMVGVPREARDEVLKSVSEKNILALYDIGIKYSLSREDIAPLVALVSTYGDYRAVVARFKRLPLSFKAKEYLDEIEMVCKKVSRGVTKGTINIDFSIVNNMNYYSGILFRGYIQGFSKAILSGGRYDGVMAGMGKEGGAIGFALYLDILEKETPQETKSEEAFITIALPKGRLGNRIYELFEKAGYPCPEIKEDNRKLVFKNKKKKIKYILVKPSDVTVYVERGIADIGACGTDILREYGSDVYELMDFKKGRCNMCVAAGMDYKEDTSKILKVATKFPNIAKDYYEKESRNIEIIKLHGSIELAPVLGLADVIVDIVETGKTLKENNLRVVEEILPISTKLIVNKSAFKFKSKEIVKLVEKLEKEVG